MERRRDGEKERWRDGQVKEWTEGWMEGFRGRQTGGQECVASGIYKQKNI